MRGGGLRRVNKKLRAAVVARANEACERCFRWCGENGSEGHLDHKRGLP